VSELPPGDGEGPNHDRHLHGSEVLGQRPLGGKDYELRLAATGEAGGDELSWRSAP
jgi:hypothetical protein